MLEELVLAGFCLLVAAVGLAVAAWEVLSGRFFSTDGLWLTLISLTLAAVFGGILAWLLYSGELPHLLRHFRKWHAPNHAPPESRTTST